MLERTILQLIIENKDPVFSEGVLSNNEIKELNVFDDLGFDSLDYIDMIVKLESTFSIQFDIEQLINEDYGNVESIIQTVKTLIDHNG